MNINSDKLTKIFFFFLGLLFVCASIMAYKQDTRFKDTAIRHTATINDIIRTKRPDGKTNIHVYVTYYYNDKEYTNALNIYTQSMRLGKEIIIYINPENPDQIYASSQSLVWLMVFSLSLICFFIPFLDVFKNNYNKWRHKKLLNYGKRIFAEIDQVTKGSSSSFLQKTSYFITCRWIDPVYGRYLYRSRPIDFDPQPILEEKSLKYLTVYIDEKNPEKYFVPLEELSPSTLFFS